MNNRILTDSEIRECESNDIYCEQYYKLLEAQDRKSTAGLVETLKEARLHIHEAVEEGDDRDKEAVLAKIDAAIEGRK